MSFVDKLPIELIKFIAQSQNMSWDLIASIVMTESSGNTLSYKYEEQYKYLYFPREISVLANIPADYMIHLQKTSWGLMQVMGAVAYELGLPHTKLPTDLLDKKTGILYGCLHLKKFLSKYGDEEKAISAYNQGSPRMENGMYLNQKYVDKVFNYLRELRKLT